MFYYLLPVQRVLLEYIIKLGDVIFLPGCSTKEDINNSHISVNEKELLKNIVETNREFFLEFGGCSFILSSSNYDINKIKKDFSILEYIYYESNRKLDYIRILECPFQKPEYFLGVPGLYNTKKYLISIKDDYKFEVYSDGQEYFHSMQRGIGLDIGVRESNDLVLYKALFSNRTDEVYVRFRMLIGDTCEALKIIDESRCFVYLFSKIDGMGLCDEYQFTENKKRILSVVANTQHEFDLLSSELYFYSKEIRTEVVHKGKKIDELISIYKVKEINQKLFNIIIKFCVSVINMEIESVEVLKSYISNTVGTFNYISPEYYPVGGLPGIISPTTTYIAEIEGAEIEYPQKRGKFIILPKSTYYNFSDYYKNYVEKDIKGECNEVFSDFSIEDFEYIIEILQRKGECIKDTPILIGLRLPKIMEDYNVSAKMREMLSDYICNRMNEFFYYDLLCGGGLVNGTILPPRVGLKGGIRLIYEFVEEKTRLYVLPIPGRVFGEYAIPKQNYNCIDKFEDEIYNILFKESNYIDGLLKSKLINLCEAEYITDCTQRISYLFDTFDALDPRSYNKEKVIKLVFTLLSTDKSDYQNKKNYYKMQKDKYRNPILHGGQNIYQIESNTFEVEKLEIYLRDVIVEICLKIHSLGIKSWDELDSSYRNAQMRLGLV